MFVQQLSTGWELRQAILPYPMGQLAMAGDIFGCHHWGGRGGKELNVKIPAVSELESRFKWATFCISLKPKALSRLTESAPGVGPVLQSRGPGAAQTP